MSRKLDALFSERVLEIEVVFCAKAGSYKKKFHPEKMRFHPYTKAEGTLDSFGEYETYWTKYGTKLYCGKPWAPILLVHYTQSIDAAWKSMKTLLDDRKADFVLDRARDKTVWRATFHWDNDWYEAIDDSPSMALVKAALLASGCTEQEIAEAEK